VAVDKVVSLPEAASLVSDGDVVALQNMATQAAPMALVRELIRQQRRDLTLVALVAGMAVDWLAPPAARPPSRCGFDGAVRRKQHQAVEAGAIRSRAFRDRSEQSAGAGCNLPFLPTRGLIGTDLIATNADNLVMIDDPFGGPQVVRAARCPGRRAGHAPRRPRRQHRLHAPSARWPDLGIMPAAVCR
jgi:glutaconate CoA-transferase subunit A